MTANPHLTDQILAALDEMHPHADCGDQCNTERASRDVATRLTEQLPGVDPKLIGEIAMHLGDAINNVIMAGRATGSGWKQCAASAVVVSLEAGAQLYRNGGAS